MKRRGAVDDGDGVTGAGGGRDHLLELGDILAGRRYPVGVDAIEHEFALACAASRGSCSATGRVAEARTVSHRFKHGTHVKLGRGDRQWLKNGSSGSQIVGVGAIAGQIFVLREPGYRLFEAFAKSFDAGQGAATIPRAFAPWRCWPTAGRLRCVRRPQPDRVLLDFDLRIHQFGDQPRGIADRNLEPAADVDDLADAGLRSRAPR